MMSFIIRMVLNYFALIVICPILVFWLKGRFFKWLRDDKNRIDKERKEWDERENSHYGKRGDIETERVYEQTKTVFNELMKIGQLSRQEILYLKEMINRLLGVYVSSYKGFKFKSDVHEIYCKLKSSHLSKSDFYEICGYLRECSEVIKARVNVKENTKEKGSEVI